MEATVEKLKLILANDDYKLQYLDFIKECEKDIKYNSFECCISLSNKETVDNDIIILMDRHKGIKDMLLKCCLLPLNIVKKI